MRMRMFFLLTSLILVNSIIALAEGYRGIVPMRSTCKDVKRILRVSTCNPPNNTFDLEEDKVKIKFSTQPCEKAWTKQWDVPVDTVLIVEQFPKHPFDFSNLKIDISKYSVLTLDNLSQKAYLNKEQGIEIYTRGNKVIAITYTPTRKKYYLLCSQEKILETSKEIQQSEKDTQLEQKIKTLFLLFSITDSDTFEDEKYLWKIWIEGFLNKQPTDTQIYILTYPSEEISAEQAKKKGEETKQLLIIDFKISENRITVVVGEKQYYFRKEIYLDLSKK